jgi:hypothetical protein
MVLEQVAGDGAGHGASSAQDVSNDQVDSLLCDTSGHISSTRSPFEPVSHINSVFSLQVGGDGAGQGASSNQTQSSSDQDIMNSEEQVFLMYFLVI